MKFFKVCFCIKLDLLKTTQGYINSLDYLRNLFVDRKLLGIDFFNREQILSGYLKNIVDLIKLRLKTQFTVLLYILIEIPSRMLYQEVTLF